MRFLTEGLAAIGVALDTKDSLAATIAQIEDDLSRALEPDRIAISLVDGEATDADETIPLRLNGSEIGVIRYRGARDPGLLHALRLLAAPIAAAVAYRRHAEHRADDDAANVDGLCAIPNRRGFDEYLADAWSRAQLKKTPLAVALLDVDYFKTYNDWYGHIAGDRCLQEIAALLRTGSGFAARYGGEEFVVVFEEMPPERATAEIAALLERLTSLNIEHAGTTLGRVSLSAGVAVVTPGNDQIAMTLIDEADRALYQAKRLGRNRICAGALVSSGPIVAKLRDRRLGGGIGTVPAFGRADDLARILSALRHARMLTLVGPPGIGKSRLLGLVADEAMRRLHRPVVLVGPELLRAGVDPATALAAVCDLTLDTRSVLEIVTDALDEREAIVILDDIDPARSDIRALCNHLGTYAPRASLVCAAPAPLGIAMERAIVVPPLGDEAALELLAFAGVTAGAASREIVRQLGGNPASVIAAAALIRTHGPEAVRRVLHARGSVSNDPAQLAALFTQPPETPPDAAAR